MGRAVAAMERQGISTVKGDRLKEALAMAEVYTKVHAAELKVQHAQAVSDRAREGAKTNVQATAAPTPTDIARVLPRLEQRRQKGIPVAKGALGSMAARFHAAYSKHLLQNLPPPRRQESPGQESVITFCKKDRRKVGQEARIKEAFCVQEIGIEQPVRRRRCHDSHRLRCIASQMGG